MRGDSKAARRTGSEAASERSNTREDPFAALESMAVLLEMLPVGVWIADRDGIIVQSNPEAQRIWSGARYVGLSQYDLFKGWWPTGERLRGEEWALARAMRSGETSRNEVILIESFDGARKAIVNAASPLRNARGEVVGGVAINQDITELRNAQESLKRAQEELESRVEERTAELRRQQFLLQYILNFVPHAIFWKDREGRLLGGNKYFLDNALGVSSVEEMTGKDDYDFFPREQADYFRKCDFAVMESGEPMLDIEEPQRQCGERGRRVLLTNKVPLRDEGGAIVGLLGSFVDITARKRMEEELAEAKRAAEAASEAKDQFLTTISHELRTPLALITGPLASLLTNRDEPLSPKVRTDLERIQRNARRLHRLVDDVLDHQKIEAGKMTIEWEAVDPVALCADIVDGARAAAERGGLELGFHAERAGTTVSLDRRKLEKIVYNLLGNALKLTPPGGRVTVGLSVSDDALELSVEDTGPGIPAEKMHLLFQRFQQLDASSTRKHEGTGIGLALVKELAEMMGGTVGVTSEVGRGSRFFVRLPCSADRLPATRRAQGEDVPAAPPRLVGEGYFAGHDATAGDHVRRAAAAGSAPRVLVAEDNPDMRSYLAEILAGEWDVALAENGREALAAAAATKPAVVVSDVMMPEMDGFELTQRLKRDPALRDIPVILLTAKASATDAVGGLDHGADDYLGKPFDPAELRARVRAAERMHRLHDELAAKNRELSAAMKRLAETQENLVQAGKMAAVGSLVAGLSHELNNPVAAILVNAQMLARRRSALDEAALEKATGTIEAQAKRCSDLVRTLLDYSRRKPADREPCDVRAAIDRALAIAAPQAHDRVVRLDARYGGAALPAVLASPSQLDSALLNVIGNALDATPSDGAVAVEARALAKSRTPGVEIEVRDTGHGIDAEHLGRIFEPFFTTKPPGRGTGLGLSLTRRFFEEHRGEIRVESEPGLGTKVFMWLPAHAVAEPGATEGCA